MKWWRGDKEREKFLEKCLELGKDREETAKNVHELFDGIYKEGKPVVFYADFTVYDYGMTNAFLNRYDIIPTYLKNDESPPIEVVDYTTYIKGLAWLLPTDSSDDAFKLLGLARIKHTDNHDTEKDVEIIMDEVLLVVDIQKRLYPIMQKLIKNEVSLLAQKRLKTQ